VHFQITYTALAANVFWCTSKQLQDVKTAAEAAVVVRQKKKRANSVSRTKLLARRLLRLN
jgi:hypothetical protein